MTGAEAEAPKKKRSKQDAIQQAARADRGLGEDLVQVVLHGPGTDEQPAADPRLDRPSRASRAITAS